MMSALCHAVDDMARGILILMTTIIKLPKRRLHFTAFPFLLKFPLLYFRRVFFWLNLHLYDLFPLALAKLSKIDTLVFSLYGTHTVMICNTPGWLLYRIMSNEKIGLGSGWLWDVRSGFDSILDCAAVVASLFYFPSLCGMSCW
jgi:hypothetical protein